jgi:hypothetical protein
VAYAAVIDDGMVAAWFEEPGINDEGADDDRYHESSPEKVIERLTAQNEGAADQQSRAPGSHSLEWLQPTAENSIA